MAVGVQCQSGSKGVVFGVVSWFRKSSQKTVWSSVRISHFRSRFSRHQPVLIVKASKKIIQISKLEEIWKGPQKKIPGTRQKLRRCDRRRKFGEEFDLLRVDYMQWHVHKGNSRRDGLLYVYLFDMWHINVWKNVWNWNTLLGQETHSLKNINNLRLMHVYIHYTSNYLGITAEEMRVIVILDYE